MARPFTVPDTEILRAIELYSKGELLYKAAESINVSRGVLVYGMKKLGFSRRGTFRVYTGDETELECTKCHKILPIAEFTKNNNKKSYRPAGHLCKKCELIKRREDVYKLSEEEFNKLWQQQDGKCACCLKGEGEVKKNKSQTLVVDHDHTTKKVRALLCGACNCGIGYARENPEVLKGLLNYLNKPAVGICRPQKSVKTRNIKVPEIIDPSNIELLTSLLSEGVEVRHLVKPSGLSEEEITKFMRPYIKERMWGRRLYRVYGLTVSQYKEIERQQGGRCAVCNKLHNHTKTYKHLLVEHNHVTGEIRGLVCYHCNIALSKFHEDPVIIQAAIKYLETQCG